MQMQTMARNQLTWFFTALAAPESLEEFWLVEISSWSISKKQAGAAGSHHLQRTLPWPRVEPVLLTLVFARFSSPTGRD